MNAIDHLLLLAFFCSISHNKHGQNQNHSQTKPSHMIGRTVQIQTILIEFINIRFSWGLDPTIPAVDRNLHYTLKNTSSFSPRDWHLEKAVQQAWDL